MRRLIGEISKVPWGAHASLRCTSHTGVLDEPVTFTLIDLVEQSWSVIDKLAALLGQTERGEYRSPNEALPDWSANDVCAWLGESHAPKGSFAVSNENTEYTKEGDKAQIFTFHQFRQVVAAERSFKAIIAKQGKENLVGRLYEFEFE